MSNKMGWRSGNRYPHHHRPHLLYHFWKWRDFLISHVTSLNICFIINKMGIICKTEAAVAGNRRTSVKSSGNVWPRVMGQGSSSSRGVKVLDKVFFQISNLALNQADSLRCLLEELGPMISFWWIMKSLWAAVCLISKMETHFWEDKLWEKII